MAPIFLTVSLATDIPHHPPIPIPHHFITYIPHHPFLITHSSSPKSSTTHINIPRHPYSSTLISVTRIPHHLHSSSPAFLISEILHHSYSSSPNPRHPYYSSPILLITYVPHLPFITCIPWHSYPSPPIFPSHILHHLHSPSPIPHHLHFTFLITDVFAHMAEETYRWCKNHFVQKDTVDQVEKADECRLHSGGKGKRGAMCY